jgi:hypothetical protein
MFLAYVKFDICIYSLIGLEQPEQKQKYAIWKAAEIRKALKEGRNPEAGPPGGDKDESPDSTTTNAYVTFSTLTIIPTLKQHVFSNCLGGLLVNLCYQYVPFHNAALFVELKCMSKSWKLAFTD